MNKTIVSILVVALVGFLFHYNNQVNLITKERNLLDQYAVVYTRVIKTNNTLPFVNADTSIVSTKINYLSEDICDDIRIHDKLSMDKSNMDVDYKLYKIYMVCNGFDSIYSESKLDSLKYGHCVDLDSSFKSYFTDLKNTVETDNKYITALFNCFDIIR